MPTPEQLFAQFRVTGEPGPLGELFDRANPQLLALALHLCGHPADAEDALQATFVTAIGKRLEWDAARPVVPWLCGILTLHAKKIGERRVRRRETALPQQDLVLDDGSPVAASERRELIGKLRQHVERLPAEQRTVLLLQLEHGLAPAQVAEVLGVPPGTVRMRLHRGVAALRGLMPAGLFALLLGALPSRGVAAVRAAVVQHAAVAAGGAFVAKKVLAVVAALVVVALGWYVVAPQHGTSERTVSERPVFATSELAGGRSEATAADVASERNDATVPAVTAADAPAALEVFGTLVVRTFSSESGRAVPHVPLDIVAVRGDADTRFDVFTVATDHEGRRSVRLPPGAYAVGLDNLALDATVAAGATVHVDLPLPARAIAKPVRGRVVFADGKPAAGAQLMVAESDSRGAGVIGAAGADGRFELPLLRGYVLLGARLSGSAPSPLEFVDARPEQEVELVLPSSGAVVTALVVDAQGAPVGGAVVEVGELRGRRRWFDRDRMGVAAPAQRFAADASGRFTANDLPAGDVSVFVRADGFAPFHRYVTTRAGATVDVRCELVRGAPVWGRVIDQHQRPVADVHVSLGGTSGEPRVTGADGRFAFRHAAVAAQQLEVAGDTIEKLFCERSENDDGEWIVPVVRLAEFPARLVDDEGRALAGWTTRVASPREREATTDADGRVVLRARADATPSLWIAPPNGIDAVMSWPWPANAVAGTETTIVVPVARHPCAVLTGRVVDAAGAPIANGRVEVRAADGKYVRNAEIAAGAFRVEGVPAGDWRLAVAAKNLRASVPVTALRHGELRDLGTLTPPPSGTLLPRVVRPDGLPCVDPGLFVFDAAGHEIPIAENGSPVVLPAGDYTWRVIPADDALLQRGTVRISAGEVTPLDVTLRSGVRRYLLFPVPRPEWGEPKHVDYVLRAPDGSEYDRGDFDPRDDMPFRYMPALATGDWRLELTLDDGRRFDGAFTLASLAPSLEPIRIAVSPAR